MHTILIVDDEKHTREGLRRALEGNFEIYLAASAQEAFALFEVERFDVLLTDLRMGSGGSGMAVIQKALTLKPAPICIMMTAYSTVPIAVEAMKHGAYDFLSKPVQLERLELLIKQALKDPKKQVEPPVPITASEPSHSGIVGSSQALDAVLQTLKRIAPSRTTVLLTGETGTGKELFAKALHDHSPRAKKPFVAVHCAALPEHLLMSELFGHERGAFSGATTQRIGRFEAAHQGTLFLDEIGELDLSTQVALLRFLETRSFERLGSNTPIHVDVRLVCATHQDLQARIAERTFREDLFYRLSVVSLQLPSLRERQGDIEILLAHFLKKFAQENQKPPLTLSPEALEALNAYSWPGNIRELRNFCESYVVTHPRPTLLVSDLDSRFFHSSPQGHKQQLLKQALDLAKGNRTRAAELMGVSRRTLYRLLEKE